MTEPCPFCDYESSDFRLSHNWQCAKCGKDYTDWLLQQKKSGASTAKPAAEKITLFSKTEIPTEAKPVQAAQSYIVLAALGVLALNFAVEGAFTWLYPLLVPLCGYYAFTIFRTGYAVAKNSVYQRDKNPNMYKLHLLGAIAFTFVVFFAWLGQTLSLIHI